MNTYVALFRGINVGGNNVLPMKELVALLEGLGSRDVETYIQSGNAVFRNEEDARTLSKRIRAEIRRSHGFEPLVMLLRPEELEKAMESNPFPEAEPEAKTLHLYFPVSTPTDPDLDALDVARSDRERFALEDGVFYLHAPDGIGRSRLAARVEKGLGIPVTGRNWRTVRKVVEMARRCGPRHQP
ncbi:DUF1697 domain-containing protein [Rubrobacter marinus]|uniref:DUF1697 domain-containing protein n=1 Tax=Rubrobacter marinus TaxID=2653852 RepID=A0A6G8Q2H9_9ACTN|nr:DUF1697 domain-containing protein [Rubrobacter marinus]